MQRKSIIIDVLPGGTLQIDLVGFKGKACDKAAKAFEDALGTVTKKIKKPEYHQDVASQQSTTG